jgi:hypothetical protein
VDEERIFNGAANVTALVVVVCSPWPFPNVAAATPYFRVLLR